MSFCDLCHEYTSTDQHCSECGHELRYVDPPSIEAPATPPPRGLVPFGAAMAPRRQRHREVLHELSEFALFRGRPCDLDMAALCIDVCEAFRTDAGIHLRRPDVCHIVSCDIYNARSFADTRLPDDWIEHVWTVLRFLIDTGRLTDDSDPEAALLEPLQCYGGLDTSGHPRPKGVDVDFACQCFRPYDPNCPPGMGQFEVGRDWDEQVEFVVHAHLRARSEDLPMSAFRPLIRLARRQRAKHSIFPVHIDQFHHIGTIPADGSVPKLWLYSFSPESRRGFDPLVLDEHGHAWMPKRHRGRRAGFRWVSIDDRHAVGVCGLASHVFAQPWPPQAEGWDDEPLPGEPLRAVPDAIDDGLVPGGSSASPADRTLKPAPPAPPTSPPSR